jgi:hypothetical protein
MKLSKSNHGAGFFACRATIAIIMLAPAAGCGSGTESGWDGKGDTGTDTDIGDISIEPDPAADNGSDVVQPEPGEVIDERICDEQNFQVHHEIVRLMLLLDQSSSMMGSSWSQATDALRTLLENPAFVDMYFGLDAFPDGYPGFWSDCGVLCFRCQADECGTLAPPQVPVAIHDTSAPAIIAHMNDPQYPQLCTFTPLVDQMAYYDAGPGPTDAPEIYDPDGSNYLVVISDGEDEGCFDGDPASSLAAHTSSILATHDIRSFAIGFGSTSGTLAAELNAIAANGGTSFTTFLHAEDGPSLAAALESIASTVITCDYVLDDVSPSADPDKVNFYLDGVVVPMDEGCSEDSGTGWHWVDDEHTTVEFCGDKCAAIKNGEIGSISATFGCPTILI